MLRDRNDAKLALLALNHRPGGELFSHKPTLPSRMTHRVKTNRNNNKDLQLNADKLDYVNNDVDVKVTAFVTAPPLVDPLEVIPTDKIVAISGYSV